MPGNEISDKLHNFFEQDNPAQTYQSHVGDGLWPIVSNDPWVSIQRQNGMPLNSNSTNSSAQSLDPERENDRHSSEISFGANVNKYALNPGFDKSHPRNQQVALNGFIHGVKGLQTRSKQAEFLEDVMVSDKRSCMLGGLGTFESQHGNPPEYSSGQLRNQVRPEVAKDPVNFDYLGNQQQHMKSQLQGMSSHPRQHQGFNDMPIWQQHLMYKQLQDLQRQQQLRQLDQGAWQQNSHKQLSVSAKQAGIEQSSALLNGVPTNNTSNYSLPNNFIGGELQTPTNSQMGIAGNMNWSQCAGSTTIHAYSNGFKFPSEQGQATRSIGFCSQQLNSSLHGTPVSNTIVSSNQHSHFQVLSPDCNDMMTKAGGNQVENICVQSAPFNYFQSDQCIHQQGCSQDCISVNTQGYQGQSLFGNASVQNQSGDVMPGGLHHMDHLQENVQPLGRPGQAVWSSNLQEKEMAHTGPSCGVASLDPTEEKLLFGTGNGDTWDASFGSWSALVEDAVRGSSNDKGLQGDGNCPSFEKTEPLSGNHPAIAYDNEKQQVIWDSDSLQTAASLNPKSFPLSNDADSNPNCHSTPSTPDFWHSSTKSAFKQKDRGLTDASHESFQQSLKDAKTRLLDQSQTQKQFFEGGLQAQFPENGVINGVQARNTYESSMNVVRSSDMEFNSRNMPGVWTHQPNVPMSNVSSHHIIKSKDWNANKLVRPTGDSSLKFHDNDNTRQSAYTKGTMHVESAYNGSKWNIGGHHVNRSELESESDVGSSQMRTEYAHTGKLPAVINSTTSKLKLEMNQGVLNRDQTDFDSHVISKEDENAGKYQHQPRMGPQAWDLSLIGSDKRSGKTSDNKQEDPKVSSNEDYASNHSCLGQHTGNVEREISLLTGNEPTHLIAASEKMGQSGRQTVMPHKFQYHPMGNSRMNVEANDSPSHPSYSQGLPQSVIGGFENQEQGYSRHLKSAGRVVSNNVMVMGKGQYTDLQINIKEAEEIQSRGTVPSYNTAASASVGRSTAQFSHNNKIDQTSQNMLELLHKVDQSRDSNVTRFGVSDHNIPSGVPEATFDGFDSRPQHNTSSSLQGFGLHLAPPAQWQLVPNHASPSQTSLNNFNTKQVESETGVKDQTRPASTDSAHSLPAAHESSKRESWDNTSSTCKDTSCSNAQNCCLAVATSDISSKGNHLQQQRQHNISSAPGHEMMDQSVNISGGGQAKINAHVKNASLLTQLHGSHDKAAADNSVQTSLPSVSGRVPPFRLPSSADNHAVASQFYSEDTVHSQSMDAGAYNPRTSGEHPPIVEARSIPQPSVTPVMSRQAVFSTILRNISAQQCLSGVQPQKLTPNIVRSIVQSTSGRGTSSWVLQKADDCNNKVESASSDFRICSASPQRLSGGEECSVKDNSLKQTPSEEEDATPKKSSPSLGQASVAKHLSDGNSSVSIPSLVRLHQQDVSKGEHGQDPFPNSQTEHVRHPNVLSSNSGSALYGPTPKSPEDQLQNYSLLKQMQTMKGADSDPSNRAGDRLIGADLGSEASQTDRKAGKGFIYGQNTVFRFPADGEIDATSHNSFQPDCKMFSFSSRGNEDISPSTSSQLAGREVCSQDTHTSRQHHLQSHMHSLSTIYKSNFMRGSQGPQINPQMAPSLFEQYGTYNKSQILDLYDRQRSANAATQKYIFPKVSDSMDNNSAVDQRIDTDPTGSLRRSISSTTMGADELRSSYRSSDSTYQDMFLRPKKRKSATSELLPWHKMVTESSRRPQSISMVELDWSLASNRLIEKVEDETEMMDDDLSMPRSRRRLILSTQLMQQLVPAVPAAVLAGEATSAYESVMYFIAKAALGDACNLISYSRSKSNLHLDSGNPISENLKISEKVGDTILLAVVDGFSGRSRKLEIDLSRLEKRVSLLDIKMECQELETFSIISRLVKFHGRSHTDGVAPHRTFPQRYVTALSMPGNLPEGVHCLSL